MSMPTRKTTIALLSCSALFITPLGDLSGPSDTGFSLVSSAYAKSSNAGGNGNGNGGGNDNGNSGGNGKSSSASGNGKSGGNVNVKSTASASSQSKGNSGNGLGNIFRGLFGKKSSSTVTSTASIGSAKKANGQAKKQTKQKIRSLAALPVPSARANAVPKVKTLNAKLAGLHSLQRNFHAYLNTNDPRMAAIQTYVMASVNYENTMDALEDAKIDLTNAQAAYDVLVTSTSTAVSTALGDASITPYDLTPTITDDQFDYATADTASLELRMESLQGVSKSLQDEIDAALLSDPLADVSTIVADKALVDEEVGLIDTALTTLSGSSEAQAVQTYTDQVSTLETDAATYYGQIGVDDFESAINLAANSNRVVDQEVLDWARNVLGADTYVDDGSGNITVDQAIHGKIDEIRDYLAAQAEAEEAALVEEEPVDPADTL